MALEDRGVHEKALSKSNGGCRSREYSGGRAVFEKVTLVSG